VRALPQRMAASKGAVELTESNVDTPVPPRVDQDPGPRVKTGLRIAFIGGRGVGSRYSGIETFYEEVGSRLAERGHEVTAYCRTGFTPPDMVSCRRIFIRRLPAPRSKHLETLVHSGLSVAHATAQRFDILHIHAIGSSVFSLLPRLTGCRTIVTVHGLDWQRPKWKGIARACLRAAEWTSVKFPTRTTAVSYSVAQYLENRYRTPVASIPNGVNLHLPVDSDRLSSLGLIPGRYVLFVGRLSEEKGCHQLMTAFRRAAPPGYQLVFAGGVTYASDYERKLRSDADGGVRFLGWVDQQLLGELYSNCAVFVLPSSIEGLSVALLEAMSYGAPVLVSDIAENLEVIGSSGAAFQVGSLEDLTMKLSRTLSDIPSLRAMGEQGRRRVREHFTWDETARAFERLYQSVMAGSPAVRMKGLREESRQAS
jgi:glycosyltransferase involved in cell wall biosynthesis